MITPAIFQTHKAMILSLSDFDNVPYKIPNQEESTWLSSFIARCETRLLKENLGIAMYTAFIAGLPTYTYSATVATVINRQYAYGNDIWKALTVTTGTTPVAGSDWELVEADNKWLVLKNGDTYEYASVTYEWVGFVEALRPAVYSLWLIENARKKTNSGTLTNQIPNTQIISPNYDIVRNWNEYCEYIGDDVESSFYGFMSVNLDDYDTDDQWLYAFERPEYLNNVGI